MEEPTAAVDDAESTSADGPEPAAEEGEAPEAAGDADDGDQAEPDTAG